MLEEIAEFFASCPSRRDILEFRPSAELQDRARLLLDAQDTGSLSAGQEGELDEMVQFERLMRLVKAKARGSGKLSQFQL